MYIFCVSIPECKYSTLFLVVHPFLEADISIPTPGGTFENKYLELESLLNLPIQLIQKGLTDLALNSTSLKTF
ncbi:MAG: hypothetical protein H7263_16470 [Candidatus Sericytochromatia bacterium]|nr:hypothetical protein [Candidatus Sericytochromatia bacterium]